MRTALPLEGIGSPYAKHTMKFMLRNGFMGFHEISGKERKRLWAAVQRADGFDNFVVYDTRDERVARKGPMARST